MPIVRTTLTSSVLALLVSTAVVAEAPIDGQEARPHILWTDAACVKGQYAFVYGTVERVGHAKTIDFLNFDAQRRDQFTVVVFDRYRKNFGDTLENLYEGQPVRVAGFVTEFRGTPQIAVTGPTQITRLETLPALEPPCASAESAARPVGEDFKLATFNVRNLFDDVDDPYRADETAPPKPRDELERLAATIRELDADLLALQEVESRDYLERFVEVLLPDMGYEVVHFEGNDLRGIDVSLLSRFAIERVGSHRHRTFAGPDGLQRFHRDLLVATVQPPRGGAFEMWIVHLKSNADGRDRSEPIRLAEANEVRALLDRRLEEDPLARIVLCGDFNDTESSATLATIVGSDSTALASAWHEIAEDQRVTYNLEPYRSMIDFILWSPGMGSFLVPGTYQIVDGSLESLGSDHCPVSVRFRFE